MKPAPDNRAKVVVVKRVPRLHKPAQERHRQAKRLYRVPDPNHLNRDLAVAIQPRKCARPVAVRRQLVVAIGLHHIAHRRMFRLQQPDAIDHPGQGPHRIGATRIAEQKDPVAGMIARGQKAIGAPDLPVDAAPLQHILRIAPVVQLNPGLVIHRQPRRGRQFAHQPVGQARVGLMPGIKRGHGAIQYDDVIDRTAHRVRLGAMHLDPRRANPVPDTVK
ncbi:hypothetical protein GALL_545280 [mine drainage metagenome]|uniref:Uncharacterized protein n=1 Tax=mine drainage metagenome TaxID=410659 RepID=A0A1J5NYQ0_9ZZZZ